MEELGTQQSRDRIAHVAEAVFIERGYRGASVQVIADGARVDKKLLYYYFLSKKGLYASLVGEAVEALRASLPPAAAYGGTARENLSKLARALHAFGVREPGKVMLLLKGVVDRAVDPEDLLSRLLPPVRAALAGGGLPEDADPRHVAMDLAGLFLFYPVGAPFLGDVLGLPLLAPQHAALHEREALRFLLDGIEPLESGDGPRANGRCTEVTPPAELDFSSFSPFLNDARGAQSVARERLLGVAETLFAEHGFAGATTQEIARRARVDKRLLFYYFADKEELRRSVLARFILKMATVQGDPQSWKGDAAENHGRIVNAFVDFAGANPALVKMFLREVLDNGASLKEFYGPILRRLFADGAKGVEEEHAAGATAYFDPVHFQFCVMGMALFYFLVADAFAGAWGEDPLSADALAARKKQLLRQILRGVRPR